MKMKYEKPMVAVERYELSQAIASCIIKIGPNGTNSCIKTDPDTPEEMRSWAYNFYFSDATCSFPVSTGQTFDGVCYHTQANAAFVS